MTDLEIIQTFRACTSAKGKRCSACPRFGNGLYSPMCVQGTMTAAAAAIERLTNELKQARAERDAISQRLLIDNDQDEAKSLPMSLEEIDYLASMKAAGRLCILPSEDQTFTIRGDLALGIIKANCLHAEENAKKRDGYLGLS